MTRTTAIETVWRWRRRPNGSSYIETVRPGQRCDWAAGGVYEQLGMVETRRTT